MSQGIDIREPGTILIRALLLDASNAIIVAGDATLKLYELQTNGTLRSFDFNDNTFKTTALTTETAALSHRTGNNGSTNTGLWTLAQTVTGGFTAGSIYIAYIEHADLPSPDVREVQWGIKAGSFDRFSDDVATQTAQNLLDYENTIWIDPDGGTDGSTFGTHGKRSVPCQTWANVSALLTASGFNRVRVIGSGILIMSSMPVSNLLIDIDPHCTIRTAGTVATASNSRLEVIGGGSFLLGGTWTIGQAAIIRIRGSRNMSGSVTGNATSSRFEVENSEFTGTLTLTGFTEWQVSECRSLHTGSGYPTIAFSSGHGTLTNWEGGLTLNSTGTGHAHLTGRSPVLTVNGTGGSVELVGEINYTDGSGGLVTIDATGVTARQATSQSILTTGGPGPWTTGAGGGGGGGGGEVTSFGPTALAQLQGIAEFSPLVYIDQIKQEINLVANDDYLHADGRSLSFTLLSGENWPADLDDLDSIKWAYRDEDGTVIATVDGVVDTATGSSRAFHFDIADTDIPNAGIFFWDCQFTDSSGNKWTPRLGVLRIINDAVA